MNVWEKKHEEKKFIIFFLSLFFFISFFFSRYSSLSAVICSYMVTLLFVRLCIACDCGGRAHRIPIWAFVVWCLFGTKHIHRFNRWWCDLVLSVPCSFPQCVPRDCVTVIRFWLVRIFTFNHNICMAFWQHIATEWVSRCQFRMMMAIWKRRNNCNSLSKSFDWWFICGEMGQLRLLSHHTQRERVREAYCGNDCLHCDAWFA